MNRKLNISLFAIWSALMFYGILLPADSMPKDLSFFFNIPFLDKVVHSIMFGGFSFFLFWLFSWEKHFKASMIKVFIIASFFGIITEVMQYIFASIINRTGDFRDFIADEVGILLALLLCYFIIKKGWVKKKRHRKSKKNI
ncbi:MAG: VanZ family protein [Bacteroidales bacterium]|jgi:VanZ family protein|nr:VanZ family protein [Bacteroidales bacterium]